MKVLMFQQNCVTTVSSVFNSTNEVSSTNGSVPVTVNSVTSTKKLFTKQMSGESPSKNKEESSSNTSLDLKDVRFPLNFLLLCLCVFPDSNFYLCYS